MAFVSGGPCCCQGPPPLSAVNYYTMYWSTNIIMVHTAETKHRPTQAHCFAFPIVLSLLPGRIGIQPCPTGLIPTTLRASTVAPTVSSRIHNQIILHASMESNGLFIVPGIIFANPAYNNFVSSFPEVPVATRGLRHFLKSTLTRLWPAQQSWPLLIQPYQGISAHTGILVFLIWHCVKQSCPDNIDRGG